MLAAQGRSAAEISETLHGLHPPVAARAVEQKLAGLDSAGPAHAGQMHTALVVDRDINDILDADTGYPAMAEARATAQGALDGLRARPRTVTLAQAREACRALREQIDEVLLKYKIYRQLPAERDAHEAGAGGRLAFEALE